MYNVVSEGKHNLRKKNPSTWATCNFYGFDSPKTGPSKMPKDNHKKGYGMIACYAKDDGIWFWTTLNQNFNWFFFCTCSIPLPSFKKIVFIVIF